MPTALRLRRLALLLALVLCLPLAARAGQAPATHVSQASAAHGNDASHRAKAAQLVTLLHSELMVQQVSSSVVKQVFDAAESALGPNPTPENKAKLADFEKKITQLVEPQLGWKAMQPAFTDLYARNFTGAELDAIVAFYKTPAGVDLLSKTPAIDAQASQLAKSRMDALQPRLNQVFDDFRKSQAPPAPAATPAPVSPAPSAATPAPTASTPK